MASKHNPLIHGTKGKDMAGGMDKAQSPGGMKETKELPHPSKNHDMTSHISDHSGGSHCPEDFSTYKGDRD